MKKIGVLLFLLMVVPVLVLGCGSNEAEVDAKPEEEEAENEQEVVVDENAEFMPLEFSSLNLLIEVPQKGWDNTLSRATQEDFEDDHGQFQIWYSTNLPNVRRLVDSEPDVIVDKQEVEIDGLDEEAVHVKITDTDDGLDVYREQLYYEYVNPENDRRYYVLITMTYPQDSDTDYYHNKFAHIMDSATIER
ncbi:hypothetical protein PRVXT_001672 [Proteinivorax tanatarense]|uniref:Uncharacterized protein n=1 Tax=Proteinivorax tanatarense TaxID=1260629 RepID=A0AAU7VHL3_9FIRM